MLANIEASFGLVFSQSVLLTLVASGLTRDDAYRIVQDNALRAWDERTSFRLLLEAEPRVTDRLDTAALDEAFDLARVLRHAQRPIEALSAIHSA
jgi:adenylosuccinate lyase